MIVNKIFLPELWFFFDIFDNKSVLAFKNLSCKIGIIFFNKHNMNQETFFDKILPFKKICTDKNQFFLVNYISGRRCFIGSKGAFIYLSDLRKNFSKVFCKNLRRNNFLLATSIHNETELRIACKNNFDLIFISPLSKTKTHPEILPHSSINFIKLCFKQKRIVFALGGATNINFKRVKNKYLVGFGAINFFLNLNIKKQCTIQKK